MKWETWWGWDHPRTNVPPNLWGRSLGSSVHNLSRLMMCHIMLRPLTGMGPMLCLKWCWWIIHKQWEVEVDSQLFDMTPATVETVVTTMRMKYLLCEGEPNENACPLHVAAVISVNGESDQPNKWLRIGWAWCSKHQELHPLPQLGAERTCYLQ